jgi:hypothetical protein
MIGDKAVLLKLEKGDYFFVSDTGFVIWELLNGTKD